MNRKFKEGDLVTAIDSYGNKHTLEVKGYNFINGHWYVLTEIYPSPKGLNINKLSFWYESELTLLI